MEHSHQHQDLKLGYHRQSIKGVLALRLGSPSHSIHQVLKLVYRSLSTKQVPAHRWDSSNNNTKLKEATTNMVKAQLPK